MKQAYRRWVCGLLACILALLAVCGAVVYVVDPCLYYRVPDKWQPVLFNERYQMAGLAKNVEADTVLVGTSMAANYRSSWIQETFGTSAVRLTIPDGYYSEFDQVMNVLFRTQEPERVIFGLDVNTLIRDESGVTAAMPDYLYNANPLDDIQYLLNKDTLYYSAYTLLSNHWGEGDTIDEGFTWDRNEWWNHISALENYDRPEIAAEELPADAYRDDVAANLAVAEGWVTEHPDTEFDFFLPPYSILFWDKAARQSTTDAMLAALELAVETLAPYENVRVYGFLLDEDIVMNLDYYCDYVHHSGAVCTQVLDKMAAGECRLTAENYQDTLAQWREFVVDYDYEKYWDDISPFIKFGCLKDEKFCDKMKDAILFKNLDGKYLTLPECLEIKPQDEEENKENAVDENGNKVEAEVVGDKSEDEASGENTEEEKKEKIIYYVTDEQQQSQYINMFKAAKMDAVILTHNIDQPFISQLEQKNEGIKFQRIDADVTDALKSKTSKKAEKEMEEQAESISKLYSMPGMDMSAFGGEGETLILNASHPLVQYITEHQDGENAEMICEQLYDLAKLQHAPLSADAMTKFVARSNDIMMLLTK